MVFKKYLLDKVFFIKKIYDYFFIKKIQFIHIFIKLKTNYKVFLILL